MGSWRERPKTDSQPLWADARNSVFLRFELDGSANSNCHFKERVIWQQRFRSMPDNHKSVLVKRTSTHPHKGS